MLTRKRIRKFVEDNRNDITEVGSVIVACTLIATIGYGAGNRHARKGWSVKSAQFDQYVPEFDRFAVLHITHKNKRVTNLRFNHLQ